MATVPSELRHLISQQRPYERVLGRKDILQVYHAMGELQKRSSSVVLNSGTHAQSLLNWTEAAKVLTHTNKEFQRPAGNIGLVPPGWLEAATQEGTKHNDWAKEICNRPLVALYEFKHERDYARLLGPFADGRDVRDWEWVALPDAGVMIVTNASANNETGISDVFFLPQLTELVAFAITAAAESLGQRYTYAQLYERCFKKPLDA